MDRNRPIRIAGLLFYFIFSFSRRFSRTDLQETNASASAIDRLVCIFLNFQQYLTHHYLASFLKTNHSSTKGASGSASDRRHAFSVLAANHRTDPIDVIIGDVGFISSSFQMSVLV